MSFSSKLGKLVDTISDGEKAVTFLSLALSFILRQEDEVQLHL